MNELLKTLIGIFGRNTQKGFAENGCQLISGATTIRGNFYGFSIGATKPTTLKIVASGVKLNGVDLASTDDIITYVSEGEFVPIEFTEMTTTGAGYVKCYNK